MALTLQQTQTIYWSSTSSPMGRCIVLARHAGVCWTGTPGASIDDGLSWIRRWMNIDRVVEDETCLPLQQASNELMRYFAGERIQIICPLDLQGTPFQLAVWGELCKIPYGETRSYGEIARAIGHPSASRAVGAANGANPIAIIVPCHRVIGSSGALVGYGGGLPTKSWLLKLEGISK
jgi:methylated-DNA-[protein]-cysteine S-methyltransferase